MNTADLPADVRLMNSVSRLLWRGIAVAVVAAGLLALTRLPAFAIRGIRIEGEVTHNSVSTIRANAAPRLVGNFFTLDLSAAKAAFESVPWVREAVVRRVWPNLIAVQLREHQAAAYWYQEEGDDKLVDVEGEVFEANLGDVEDQALPTLRGPEGTAAQMLAVYRRLVPVFQQRQAHIDTLHLSGRGSWQLEFDDGAVIELGRGGEEEVASRAERFVRTVGQVTERYARPLVYADLRHADGYAVRLQGVSTTLPPPPAKRPPSKPQHPLH